MSDTRRSIPQRGVPRLILLFATLIGGWGPQASGEVVINELMYHPPEDSDRLQYIELHNPGDGAVNLSGWSFDKGVRFKFPEQTVMEAGGFLVVCHDLETFANHYGGAIATIGNFKGRLSHQGETLRLVDSAGKLVDEIEYRDAGAWPRGADGYGASLERITPLGVAQEASGWASSEMPEWKESRGSPGRRNDSFSAVSLPGIQEIEITPRWPQVDESVRVEAKVSHAAGIESVSLRYRVAQSRRENGTKTLPMTLAKGIASAEIPGVPAGSLVRLQIMIEGQDGAIKMAPSGQAPRPAWSYYVGNVPTVDRVGHGVLINVGEVERGVNKFHRARLGRDEREPTRGNSAFVYYPASETTPLLYDFIRVTQRNGGFKLRFHPDRPFEGMTVMNVLYEGNPRYLLFRILGLRIISKG